jgi:hypothetical protein
MNVIASLIGSAAGIGNLRYAVDRFQGHSYNCRRNAPVFFVLQTYAFNMVHFIVGSDSRSARCS